MTSQSARPQGGTEMPPNASATDVRALLTGNALRHLEPYPGGQWKLLSQTGDSIFVVYVLDDGTEVMTTTIIMAVTPDNAAQFCWPYLHSFPDGKYSRFDPGVTLPEDRSPAAYDFPNDTQMHQQAGDLNSVWAADTAVQQAGVPGASANAQLLVSDQYPTLDHHLPQPPDFMQIADGALMMPMESFQSTQPINVSLDGQGDFSAFQSGEDAAATASSLVSHGENVEGVNAEFGWGSFNGNV
ncbi:mating type MAT1-2-3 [Fusarium heterosporum]|uniref:Mating type MAT1-2-3 n=1 Tax=Fusarium heterosporum TaxID=42747 RepID=A0A8H5WYQ4_FUSHE|nr:mating type MAT1-2-3 [Fusarium heterosporum]